MFESCVGRPTGPLGLSPIRSPDHLAGRAEVFQLPSLCRSARVRIEFRPQGVVTLTTTDVAGVWSKGQQKAEAAPRGRGMTGRKQGITHSRGKRPGPVDWLWTDAKKTRPLINGCCQTPAH